MFPTPLIIGLVASSVVAAVVLLRQRARSRRGGESEHAFGEDSIASQIDPTPKCPRTGVPVDGEHLEAPCLDPQGLCPEWAAKGVQVPCLRAPRQEIAKEEVRKAA